MEVRAQRLSRKRGRGSGVCRVWLLPTTRPGDPHPQGRLGLGRHPGPASNRPVTIWAASLPQSLVHSPLAMGSTPGALCGSQGALTIIKSVVRSRGKLHEDFYGCRDAL